MVAAQPACRSAADTAIQFHTRDLYMIDYAQSLRDVAGGRTVMEQPPMLSAAWLFQGAAKNLQQCDMVSQATEKLAMWPPGNRAKLPQYAVHQAYLMFQVQHMGDAMQNNIGSKYLANYFEEGAEIIYNFPIGHRLLQDLSGPQLKLDDWQGEIRLLQQRGQRREVNFAENDYLLQSQFGKSDQWEFVVDVAIKIMLTQQETVLLREDKSTIESIVEAAYDEVLLNLSTDVDDVHGKDQLEARKSWQRVAKLKCIPRVYKDTAAGGDVQKFAVRNSNVTKQDMTRRLERWYRSFVYQRYYGRSIAQAVTQAKSGSYHWDCPPPVERVKLLEHIRAAVNVTAWVDAMTVFLQQCSGMADVDWGEIVGLSSDVSPDELQFRQFSLVVKDMDMDDHFWPKAPYEPVLFMFQQHESLNVYNARTMLQRIGDLFLLSTDKEVITKHHEKGLDGYHPGHREKNMSFALFCRLRRRKLEQNRALTPRIGSSAPPRMATLPAAPQRTDYSQTSQPVEAWLQRMRNETEEFNDCFRQYRSRHDTGGCPEYNVVAVEENLRQHILNHIGVDMGSGDGCRVPTSVNAVLLNMVDPSTCLDAVGALVTILCHSYSAALHTGVGGTNGFDELWQQKLDFLLYLLVQHLHASTVGKAADEPLTSESICLVQMRNATDIETRMQPQTQYSDIVRALDDSECRRLLFPHRCLAWLRVLNGDPDEVPDKYSLGGFLRELQSLRLIDRAKVYTWTTLLSPQIKHEKHIVEHIVCLVLVLAGVDRLQTGICFSGIYPPPIPTVAYTSTSLAHSDEPPQSLAKGPADPWRNLRIIFNAIGSSFSAGVSSQLGRLAEAIQYSAGGVQRFLGRGFRFIIDTFRRMTGPTSPFRLANARKSTFGHIRLDFDSAAPTPPLRLTNGRESPFGPIRPDFDSVSGFGHMSLCVLVYALLYKDLSAERHALNTLGSKDYSWHYKQEPKQKTPEPTQDHGKHEKQEPEQDTGKQEPEQDPGKQKQEAEQDPGKHVATRDGADAVIKKTFVQSSKALTHYTGVLYDAIAAGDGADVVVVDTLVRVSKALTDHTDVLMQHLVGWLHAPADIYNSFSVVVFSPQVEACFPSSFDACFTSWMSRIAILAATAMDMLPEGLGQTRQRLGAGYIPPQNQVQNGSGWQESQVNESMDLPAGKNGSAFQSQNMLWNESQALLAGKNDSAVDNEESENMLCNESMDSPAGKNDTTVHNTKSQNLTWATEKVVKAAMWSRNASLVEKRHAAHVMQKLLCTKATLGDQQSGSPPNNGSSTGSNVSEPSILRHFKKCGHDGFETKNAGAGRTQIDNLRDVFGQLTPLPFVVNSSVQQFARELTEEFHETEVPRDKNEMAPSQPGVQQERARYVWDRHGVPLHSPWVSVDFT